ncbi:P-loop containing nucleoside triphosphate hydrolase protein [Catenaria anguillulae PL171]|uniref:p-loop containing nucleoside triphosphate hydrolase protein n=1 Tax=Catenaria anguillulae PL171 TaxID=765915 RepID=A0A1Y2HVL1_9FUNG|nr:P-loop containing nucleoside triphosphate hydrolase protein [Catenaria anguillulae PL171]
MDPIHDWVIKRQATKKLYGKNRYFIDKMRVQVKAGNGGDGCIAFLRESGRPKGPPAGGNGGRGGDIVFVANPEMSTLRGINAKYAAPSGAHGSGKMMHGKNAQHLVVQVPVGTVVTDYVPPSAPKSDTAVEEQGEETIDGERHVVSSSGASESWMSKSASGLPGEQEDILTRLKLKNPDMPFLSDLLPRAASTSHLPTEIHFDTPGQTHTLVHGGAGGYGNIHFSGTHKSPRERTLGTPGQLRTLQLELKTIADLGLVGLPNAGKSSLLNAVSNASSKVADYPFTTLNPFLGTLVYPDAFKLTMADIPGLVAGAHRNVGLGHDFLRHIERSRALVFVVDLSTEPVKAMETLVYELEKYRPGLTKRPALVVGNKADVVPRAQRGLEDLKKWLAEAKYLEQWGGDELVATLDGIPQWEVVPLSAKFKANVPALMVRLRQLVEQSSVQRLGS